MSTLAAVIGNFPRRLVNWNSQIVLPDDPNPFYEFHAKFWGVKEVADTEDEREDEGDMEIDDSTAKDDDIDPSCYVLDINIRGAEDKIWVRAEYIRMFKFAEEFYAENASNPLSPCLVITGQPGIGELCQSPYHYATDITARQESLAMSYKTVIWTLVDSVDAPSGPPIGLITHGSQHFVIYTTSPTPSRWTKLHQSTNREVCVMNPWTKAEIHRAAPFRAPGVSLADIDAIFYELGPTPRLCFWGDKYLIKHRKNLEAALSELKLNNLEDMSTAGLDLALDAVSHRIYMLRRSPGVAVNSDQVDVMIISPGIASRVAFRLRALQRYELVRLFRRYSALPSTRKMSGDVFEAYCHVIFSTRIKLDFVPMVRIGGRPTAKVKNSPQWHSSHTQFRGSAQSNASQLETLRTIALTNGASLSISPSLVFEYDPKEVADGLYIEADVYYLPVKPNQVGIDSFIVHDNHLYLLQMTVTDSHGISDGLWPFLVSLEGLPPTSNWHFIFVKPPGKILACPVPHSAELRDLYLYSAEVEVE